MAVAALSAARRAPAFGDNWRLTPLSALTTAGTQKLGAAIDYSVRPRWVLSVTSSATSKGVATFKLGDRTFTVLVKQGQTPKTTAQRFQAQLQKAGFFTQLSGQPAPSPVRVRELIADIAETRRALLAPKLDLAQKSLLTTRLEVYQAQLAQPGTYRLSFGSDT